jgi:hypothetical protein
MPKIAGIVIAATLASLPCSGGYAGEPHPASLYISDEILDTVTSTMRSPACSSGC